MIQRVGGRLALAALGLLVALAASPAAADATDARAAAEAARAAGDVRAELGHRMRLAEGQQEQGLHEEAVVTLSRALELAESLGDARPVAAVRGALGNVHVALQQDDVALRELTLASEAAREARAPGLAASLGNNLANLLAMQPGEESAQQAARAYATAREDALAAGDAALAARILGNEARLQLERGDLDAAGASLVGAASLDAKLEPSPDGVLTRVHLGLTYLKLFEARERAASEGGAKRDLDRDKQDLLAAHALLTKAEADARRLGDARGSAWAQGTLARIYAHRGHLDEALVLARRAVFDAQQAGAVEAELRFQLESARLLARMGRRDEAIAGYGVAVERLAEIRPALGFAYARHEGSPREEASRAYREMADLLLARAAEGGDSAESDLRVTQRLMERFKADELREYFQDDCVDAYQERVAGADTVAGALVVYPIVLDDRLEILTTRGGSMRQYSVPVPRATLETQVRRLRALLEKRITREYLPHAQRVYDWLVRPFEAELEASRGATIVFVPDGVLRIIPMAALHDGERFLIDRHPVATTPGLELSDPRPIDRNDPRMLLAGLAEAVRGLAALPHVREELTSIQAMYPGDVLFDDTFMERAIEERITSQDYGLVHIASHGQLGAKVADSYLVTHDGRIELSELAALLTSTRYRERPVELIALSACDTAAGDERAALGLSGLAVRAGARSALGSLWLVNDEAASRLMIDFYTELRQPGVSRAHALQHAQRKLLADDRWRHPGYWAPFLLISNWL